MTKRSVSWLMLLSLLLVSLPVARAAVPCAELTGKAKAECEHKERLRDRPRSHVLKMKPATTNGQILSPGEKPPTTTLEESRKTLTPGATTEVPPPIHEKSR